MSNVIVPLKHQTVTLDKLNEQLKNSNKSLVVLPSGSGKTHTIAFHVKQIKPKRFMYIVHRNVILFQTIGIFKEVLGIEDKDIGILNSQDKVYDKPYLFASMQTLTQKRHLEKFDKNSIDYIVIDEYHHVATYSYQKIVNYFKPRYLIGLTATPFRLDDQNIMKYVDNNIAYNIDLFKGIADHILAPFHYVGLFDNIDYTQVKHNGYSYNITDLDRHLIIYKRDEAVLRIYLDRIAPENRITIGFCNSIAHVERMVKTFRQAGIKAVGITAKDSIDNREETLKQFKAGNYKVLFARDILNEGVDFPECSALLFLRPTISKTIFFQQLGRGLRKHPLKEDVLVLDFIGNYDRAFEKRTWFKNFPMNFTGEFRKPVYVWDSPSPVIEFDSRVVELMELQERFFGDKVTKEMLKADYLNCCKLENKKQLSAKEYNDSRFRRCSYRSVSTLFDGFRSFIAESEIPYETNQVGPIGWMACRDKQKLIDNYYEVKKDWVAAGNRNRFFKRQEFCPPSTVMDDPKLSKYSTYCYRKVWGTYRKFLLAVKELKNKPNIVLYDTAEVKELKINMLIKAIQKKLGRDYITLSDWRKEYGGLVKNDIDSLGGFGKFREKYNIPSSNIYNCSVCGKEFTTQYSTSKHYVCSDSCRNKTSWIKTKKPRNDLKNQEKLKETITCLNCGKTVPKYTIHKNGHVTPKQLFCSKECSNSSRYLKYKARNKHV